MWSHLWIHFVISDAVGCDHVCGPYYNDRNICHPYHDQKYMLENETLPAILKHVFDNAFDVATVPMQLTFMGYVIVHIFFGNGFYETHIFTFIDVIGVEKEKHEQNQLDKLHHGIFYPQKRRSGTDDNPQS